MSCLRLSPLRSALAACRAALRVYIEAAHPLQWAMTQEDIGLTFEQLAAIDAGSAPKHLQAAIDAFDCALCVYDPSHESFLHNKATTAHARVAAKLAALESGAGPEGG